MGEIQTVVINELAKVAGRLDVLEMQVRHLREETQVLTLLLQSFIKHDGQYVAESDLHE